MATTLKAERFMRGRDRFYRFANCVDPGVTTVCGALAKPVLVNWAGKRNRERVCDEAADFYDALCASGQVMPREWFRSSLWERVEKRAFHNEEARAAADLGTLAHARCEWIVRGRVGVDPIAEAPAGSDRERALWASLAFEQWVADHKVEFVETEIVVHHPEHHYAGTCDLIARVDGRLAVVDLKTSSGLWSEMYLQIAAYWAAYSAMHGNEDFGLDAYLVRLPKKVTDPEFEAVQVHDLFKHLNAFLALKDVFAWMGEVTR